MCYGTSSGRISQLFHFGPILAISIIVFISSCAFMCLFQWWPAKESDPLSILNMGCFLAWPLFIFYNYFNAVFLGPGFVPKDWKPVSFCKFYSYTNFIGVWLTNTNDGQKILSAFKENKEDERKLQFCKICDSFKAPRSHHCRKCNRCVFKMVGLLIRSNKFQYI